MTRQGSMDPRLLAALPAPVFSVDAQGKVCHGMRRRPEDVISLDDDAAFKDF